MKKLYFSIVGVFFVLVTMIAVSYAWFINSSLKTPEITGYSASAYFAGGNGTQTDPYIINNSRHLYNLAWLQYLGQFNQTSDTEEKELTKQVYFKIEASEIDMDGIALPPIGTEENPFMGVLDGNGCVVKNLTVSNDLTKDLTRHPNSAEVTYDKIKNIKIIGMFGVVGNYGEKYTNVASSVRAEVKNLTLDNIGVQSIAAETLVGLLAGYVAQSGDVENIGIHYSNIRLASGVSQYISGNISNYGLIGDYDSDMIEWEDKPTSGGQGTDLAYGGNFDVNVMLQRLNLIVANNRASPYLPAVDSNTNDYPVPESGSKLPLTVVPSSITEENYTGSEAKEVISSQNIGYYIGNQNKINKSTINFCDPLNEPTDMNSSYTNDDGETPQDMKQTPRQFFIVKGGNGNYAKTNIEAMDAETFASLPEGIRNIIPSENTSLEQYTIRLSQRFPGSVNITNNDQNDAWSYQGQINYYGQTYGSDVANYDSAGICLPNNAIWFRPKNAGTLRFVMYSGSNGKSFKLIKVNRNSGTEENPFAGTDITGSEVSEITNTAKNIPLYLLVYYEYEVTEEDIQNNVEFMLYRGDESGAYFLYMDIGINGSGEDPQPTYIGTISGVDFVYLTDSVYSNPLENKSNVAFVITNTSTGVASSVEVAYYFRRKKDVNGETDWGVLYFVSTQDNGLTITNSASGTANLAADENCNTIG